MSAAWWRRQFRGFGCLFLALLACAGSMAISFQMVRWLTRDLATVQTVDRLKVIRAREYRHFANNLADLGNRYAARVPEGGGPVLADDRRWLERDLLPRVQDFEARLRGDHRLEGEALTALRGAAARVAAMAKHPGDPALRAAAFAELRHAIELAESVIASYNVDHLLHEAPARLEF